MQQWLGQMLHERRSIKQRMKPAITAAAISKWGLPRCMATKVNVKILTAPETRAEIFPEAKQHKTTEEELPNYPLNQVGGFIQKEHSRTLPRR
jgi:hypothetical protein